MRSRDADYLVSRYTADAVKSLRSAVDLTP